MKKGWSLFWAFCLALRLIPAGDSFGQVTTSTISGIVRDTTQAVIPGATVTATNVETGVNRDRLSDEGGRYRIGELQPGTYEITVALAGFSRETRKDIVLRVGQEQSLNFTLQVGTLDQEVVVTGEAPLVETATT